MAGSFAAIVTITLSTVVALAAPPVVGDKPNIAMQTVDGRAVTSDIIKGRIIILDFWATWCGPCMHEAPHMVELNKKYADQGVAIIGISLDNDIAEMQAGAKQNGITWPQVFDGGGFNSPIAHRWGVDGIPHTVILSPDGEVLWSGHPSQIDEPLAAIVKKYPTQPVLLKKAQDLLQQSLKMMADEQDTSKVIALLASLPAGVKPNSTVTTMAGQVARRLGKVTLDANPDTAKALLALGAKPILAASPSTSRTPPNPSSASASLADSKLAAAEKARASGDDVAAYTDYKWIVAHAADTPAAESAQARITAYEADDAFTAKLKKAQREQDAGSLLWMAQSLEKDGNTDAAITKYKSILTDFAGTNAANEAKADLERLK
jgi:thiol-disulfide isomerase/thioredoxin